MLRIKSEGKKQDIVEVRKQYKKRIRQEHLQQIFQSIRFAVINSPDLPQPELEPQLNLHPQPPPFILYIPPNYNQQLSFLMQMPSIPYLPPASHYRQPFPLQIAAEADSEIYFQGNGIVVFKKQLGSGSYSKVWEGRVLATGVKVAVKQVEKLQANELKCLQELTSEYIVKVLDIIPHKRNCFIVLEFCDRNLRDELKNCQYKLELVQKYFQEIIYGMDVLQSRNILHRDLKFQNILVKEGKIKLADFGLAKFMGQQLEVESRRCGTPYTMAPEVYFCQSKIAPYTIKSDIWSIGVILHQMLYQVHPFGANSYQFQRKRRVKVRRRFGVLDQLIDRCLTREPALRIDWNDFKLLFCKYLQEKHLYPILTRDYSPSHVAQREDVPRMMKKERKVYEDVAKPAKVSPVHKEKQQKRQISRDVRKERTPPKRTYYKSPRQVEEVTKQRYGQDRYEQVKDKTLRKQKPKVQYEDKKRQVVTPPLPSVARIPAMKQPRKEEIKAHPPQILKKEENQSSRTFSITEFLIFLVIVLALLAPFTL